jgi:hypothetical protein
MGARHGRAVLQSRRRTHGKKLSIEKEINSANLDMPNKIHFGLVIKGIEGTCSQPAHPLLL